MAGRRRANGEGSVCRRADGRWAVSVTVGQDGNGRGVRRTVYARTQREALDKLARLRSDQLDGKLAVADRTRLADYLERWLEDSVRPSVSRSTHRSYGGFVRNHIGPTVGGVPLRRLAPQHVQGLYSEMERRGASPRLRQMTHVVLRRALSQAVQWGLIARNPCDAVARPKAPRKEARYLDRDEVRALLDAARGDRLEALCVLAVATGMRQGELLGLQWGDVDLGAGTLAVRRQLREHADGELELGELKTAKSRRLVHLPATAVDSLKAHRSLLGSAPKPDDLVITDLNGGPVRKSNLLRRWFYPLLARAGLPRIRFHDLRHTHATLLLAQGVNPKVVQERLGHSQISMTLDTYSHVVPSIQLDAARRFDDVLKAAPRSEQ